MIVAVIGIGAPGSGKSAGLSECQQNHFPQAVVIAAEEERRRLSEAARRPVDNQAVWEAIHARIAATLGSGQSVIIDAPNTNHDARRQLVNFCRQQGAEFVFGAWYDETLEHCLRRKAQQTSRVPFQTIISLHAELERHPPTTDEGFDEVWRVTAPPLPTWPAPRPLARPVS